MLDRPAEGLAVSRGEVEVDIRTEEVHEDSMVCMLLGWEAVADVADGAVVVVAGALGWEME